MVEQVLLVTYTLVLPSDETSKYFISLKNRAKTKRFELWFVSSLTLKGWICQWWLLKTLKTWLGGRVRSRVFTQKDEFLGAAVKIMHLFEKYQRWGAPAILQ